MSTRWVVIVSRRSPDLYAYLVRSLTEAGVEIVIERRYGERRKGQTGADLGRRRGDRRGRVRVESFGHLGYTIARIEEGPP